MQDRESGNPTPARFLHKRPKATCSRYRIARTAIRQQIHNPHLIASCHCLMVQWWPKNARRLRGTDRFAKWSGRAPHRAVLGNPGANTLDEVSSRLVQLREFSNKPCDIGNGGSSQIRWCDRRPSVELRGNRLYDSTDAERIQMQIFQQP
ncbi:MAG: hypothetical protein QNJ97_28750 [Myxococcota bacterium]|nr:hypothetical protein [Myxococcota bacterium]